MTYLAKIRSFKGWGKSNAFGFCLEVFLGVGKKIRIIATLALGSRPKQGLAKAWVKREAWECGRV